MFSTLEIELNYIEHCCFWLIITFLFESINLLLNLGNIKHLPLYCWWWLLVQRPMWYWKGAVKWCKSGLFNLSNDNSPFYYSVLMLSSMQGEVGVCVSRPIAHGMGLGQLSDTTNWPMFIWTKGWNYYFLFKIRPIKVWIQNPF